MRAENGDEQEESYSVLSDSTPLFSSSITKFW